MEWKTRVIEVNKILLKARPYVKVRLVFGLKYVKCTVESIEIRSVFVAISARCAVPEVLDFFLPYY